MGGPAPKITFPQLAFPIKIIGDNPPGFYLQEYVIECVKTHIKDWDPQCLSVRRSGQSNYLAVSIDCNIHSLGQLKALVRDLRSHKHVRLVL